MSLRRFTGVARSHSIEANPEGSERCYPSINCRCVAAIALQIDPDVRVYNHKRSAERRIHGQTTRQFYLYRSQPAGRALLGRGAELLAYFDRSWKGAGCMIGR